MNDTIEAVAAKDFDIAPDCRTTVNIKKGDKIPVSLSSAQGMIAAGQIKEPKNFAKMLDGVMTKKEDGDEPVNLSKMNKSELEAHGKEAYGVDLDKRKSKSDMLQDINVLAAAKAAHEANKAYCESIGDDSQPSWADAPDWQKESAVAGVHFHMDNPDADDAASHNNWMAQKEADGWTRGDVKDPEAKTHPCMVPFEELPEEQQAKDALFRTTVHECLNADA